MLNLREQIEEDFAEAQMKGRRKSSSESRSLADSTRKTSEPIVAKETPPPFANEVVLRGSTNGGGFNVQKEVVPIPSLSFECPRHCGEMLLLKAGMTLEQAMGGHSCTNAVGHKAHLEEAKRIAEARERGWRLGSVTSVASKKNEMTVRYADGECVRMTAGSYAKGERVWVKHLSEGDVLPGCKETKATKEMWVVERADK